MSRLYSKLDARRREIRLLTIHSSLDHHSSVECSLEIVSLNDDPLYCAHSYVWGKENINENIVVNGISIPVMRNLAQALKQLRMHWKHNSSDYFDGLPKFLWADAICIDQTNIAERGSQVNMMRDIFQTAVVVFAWLGPEEKNSAKAIAAIRKISEEVPGLPSEDSISAWLKRYPNLFGGEDIWRAIIELWSRSFWSRTWIIQEMVLAKEILVMCGEEVLDWDMLSTFDECEESIRRSDPVAIQRCHRTLNARLPASFRKVWRDESYPSDFVKTLRMGRGMDATDPRDKVYGLLGLAKLDIVPDYTCSVLEVYEKAAMEYLQTRGLSFCLNEAGTGRQRRFDLPTWVPDWSCSTWWNKNPSISPQLWRGAGLETANAYTICIGPNERKSLKVWGFPLSQVEDIESSYLNGSGDHNPNDRSRSAAYLVDISSIWSFTQRTLESQPGGRSSTRIPPLQAISRLTLFEENPLGPPGMRLDIPSADFFTLGGAFLRLLCFDMDHPDLPLQTSSLESLAKLGLLVDETFAASFSQQFLGKSSPLGPWGCASDVIAMCDRDAYFKVIDRRQMFLYSFRLFRTANGLLGCGPCNMQHSDWLSALKGCKFPVILRQIGSGSHYKLVRTANVIGITDGELFGELRKESAFYEIDIL